MAKNMKDFKEIDSEFIKILADDYDFERFVKYALAIEIVNETIEKVDNDAKEIFDIKQINDNEFCIYVYDYVFHFTKKADEDWYLSKCMYMEDVEVEMTDDQIKKFNKIKKDCLITCINDYQMKKLIKKQYKNDDVLYVLQHFYTVYEYLRTKFNSELFSQYEKISYEKAIEHFYLN